MRSPIDISAYLADWKRRKAGRGEYSYNPATGAAVFVPNNWARLGAREQTRYLKSLPAAERKIARANWPAFQLLPSVEPKLTHPMWKRLKRLRPLVYGRLVLGIWQSDVNQVNMEWVEDQLVSKGSHLTNLRTVEQIDPAGLEIRGHLQQARALERMLRSVTKKMTGYLASVETLASDEACADGSFRDACVDEAAQVRLFLERYTEDVRRLIDDVRNRVDDATAALAQKTAMKSNVTAERHRSSEVLTAMMTALYRELRAIGFSSRKSYMLIDRIIHAFLPRNWPLPTDESYKRVRLRLTRAGVR